MTESDTADLSAQARAHLAAGRAAEALGLLDTLLRAEPRSLAGNLLKGQTLAALDRVKGAAHFYGAALQLAQRDQAAARAFLPALRRAQAFCENAGRLFQERMDQAVRDAGFSGASDQARMARALDIAAGRCPIYTHRPTRFYFPGLPVVEFFSPDDFPFFAALRERQEVIVEELTAVLSTEGSFRAYLGDNAIAPVLDRRGGSHRDQWTAFHFFDQGKAVPENQARCPRTMTFLEEVPLCRLPGASPNALFSRLPPGASIPPHTGQTNIRLICHLPLIVEGQSRLRVGGATEAFRVGTPVIFDDSIEHDSRNTGPGDRINLIFDIWRPDISGEERRMITALFAATESLE